MLEIENITKEEREKIKELKSLIDHELPFDLQQDQTLYYRFLKARDFHLKHAEAMMRKHLADRKQYAEEVIVKKYNPPDHIYDYFPFSFIGFDKEGSVIRYIDLGRADHKGIVSMYTFMQIAQYIVVNLEEDIIKMTEQSEKLGKSITKFTLIINADKLNLFTATFKKGIEYLLKGFELYQDNYPERVKAVYVVNTSFYFNMAYPIVKAILSNVLLQKIHIYGRDGWREVLLEKIDADVLPAFLGGNRTDIDGNPWCTSFVVLGRKIPERLYLYGKKIKSIINEKGVKKIVIQRRSTSEIVVHVFEENTRIEWEFETKAKDIGFGLYYKDTSKTNPAVEELIPTQRIDTMLSSEAGVYKCDKIGNYTIVFDNSYSWMHSKEIYYRIRLTKPNMIKRYSH